jgi:hypothetical protein
MPSTYSPNLAIELIGTGDQAGSWGASTNTNLGTLIEQAISGYVTQTITDGADTVITIPNGSTGVARNMFIECTGALTAARNLIVPANKKLYFIFNNTTGGFAVTVKVSGQTGVSVPNGKKMVLVSNGTDIFVATNHLIGTVVGDVTGNITGNITGNVTGNVAGNVTGNVTGNVSGSSGSCTGNSATVTNGVYTTGNQSIAGVKTFTDAVSITSTAQDTLTMTSSSSGGVNLKLVGTSGSPAAPNKFIRSLAGVLEVINSAYTATLMQVYDAGDLAFNSGFGSSRVAYGCRAWVNFNGTGTVAIRGAGGVSSITDNGTGDYTVNFSAAMVDANYAVTGSAGNDQTLSNDSGRLFSEYGMTSRSTSACRVCTAYVFQGVDTTVAIDSSVVSVAIHR